MWKIADPIRFFQTVYSVDRADVRLDDIINASIMAAISSRKRNDIVEINPLEVTKKSVKQEIKNEIINFTKTWLNKFGIEIFSLDIKIDDRTV